VLSFEMNAITHQRRDSKGPKPFVFTTTPHQISQIGPKTAVDLSVGPMA
jgi:hypothetical protein